MFSRRNNKTNARTLAALDTQPKSNLLAATIKDAERLETYALILDGDALAPKYQSGDLLTIATNALPPLAGDAVVAEMSGRHFCAYLNADGDLWDGNGGFVPRGFFTVAGIVLDRTPQALSE